MAYLDSCVFLAQHDDNDDEPFSLKSKQFMENWCYDERTVYDAGLAKHYETVRAATCIRPYARARARTHALTRVSRSRVCSLFGTYEREQPHAPAPVCALTRVYVRMYTRMSTRTNDAGPSSARSAPPPPNRM
eukprot:6181791-Pleurochrysis_carterae.AAC.1